MNLQEELKVLKERIAELEELSREFPQNGDEYWFIDEEGSVSSTLYDNRYIDDYYIDRRHQTIGNMFRTEEQAEFAVEKLKVEAELRNLSDSWDLEKTQYTFSFNWEVTEFEIEYPDYNQYPDSYYFDSINALELALETVGEDRIKKYLFGMEG